MQFTEARDRLSNVRANASTSTHSLRAALREDAMQARSGSVLKGLPGGGFNIAYEAIDRHAMSSLANRVALRWRGRQGRHEELTYAELRIETNRFANVLGELGVDKGDQVFALLGSTPELYIAAFGALKAGAVFCPLQSGFDPETIQTCMEVGEAKVLITTPRFFKNKIAPIRDRLPGLANVLLASSGGHSSTIKGTLNLSELMSEASNSYSTLDMPPDAPAVWQWTGRPEDNVEQASLVRHGEMVRYATGRHVPDLRKDDVFWCNADPGRVVGTPYNIIAPLVFGATNLIVGEDVRGQNWYKMLEEEGVSVCYTTPTAIESLMKSGTVQGCSPSYPKLRHMVSIGEPLDAKGIARRAKAFGMPFHDL